MIRLLINLGLSLLGNALGLLVANAVLDDMSMTWQAWLIAVLIFTGAMIILQPLVLKMSLRYGTALGGSSSLISTFFALLITTLVTEGLDIDGALTWLLATVIVWAVSMLGGLFLPWILLRNSKYARNPARAMSNEVSAQTKTWS